MLTGCLGAKGCGALLLHSHAQINFRYAHWITKMHVRAHYVAPRQLHWTYTWGLHMFCTSQGELACRQEDTRHHPIKQTW
jgi:hypothetical protein